MSELTQPETDAQLAERYHATGDRRARNELIERHRHIADVYAKRYSNRGANPEDLRQTGLLAMVRAVDRFDPARGIAFSTFASRTVEGEIKRYFRDKTWAVRPPRDLQELHLQIRAATDELTQRLGRSPTVAQLASELDETVDHVLEAMEASAAHSAGPVAPVHAEGDSDDDDVYGSLGAVDDGFDQADSQVLVKALIAQLPPRDQLVVYMRFFEGRTQPEIAAEIGVSQSYLSRIIRNALTQMREHAELVA